MSPLERTWLSTTDVLKLLTAAAIATPDGELWDERKVTLWMHAAGQNTQGIMKVHRGTFHDYFPEVLPKLGVPPEKLPKWPEHLYCVEFDGMVKFGFSRSPVKRIATHLSAGRAYRRVPGRIWISEPHKRADENERTMKATTGGREYLPDATFDETVGKLQQLPKAGPGKFYTEEELYG
jgi:hypothetical protein